MSEQQNKYEIMVKIGPYPAQVFIIKAWSETEAIKKAEEKYPASYTLRYPKK